LYHHLKFCCSFCYIQVINKYINVVKQYWCWELNLHCTTENTMFHIDTFVINIPCSCWTGDCSLSTVELNDGRAARLKLGRLGIDGKRSPNPRLVGIETILGSDTLKNTNHHTCIYMDLEIQWSSQFIIIHTCIYNIYLTITNMMCL
jgi:hypothetical protein